MIETDSEEEGEIIESVEKPMQILKRKTTSSTNYDPSESEVEEIPQPSSSKNMRKKEEVPRKQVETRVEGRSIKKTVVNKSRDNSLGEPEENNVLTGKYFGLIIFL